jgi:hypothetical protein
MREPVDGAFERGRETPPNESLTLTTARNAPRAGVVHVRAFAAWLRR